jgi:hypothetical protein
MTSRGAQTEGGLTAFDVLKIVAAIVVILVAIRLIGAAIGAVMAVIWTLVIAVVVIAGLWVAWSVFSSGRRKS